MVCAGMGSSHFGGVTYNANARFHFCEGCIEVGSRVLIHELINYMKQMLLLVGKCFYYTYS